MIIRGVRVAHSFPLGLSLALLSLLAHAPRAAADTVGVIYTGADAAAGTLPDAVETRIALSPGVTVRPGAEIAARLWPGSKAPLAPRGAGEAALEEAEALFYKGNLAEAAEKLRAADAALAPIPTTATHLRARLLAGAVKFKAGDLPGADGEIRRALVIDPDLDATAFPPSFAERVDEARRALPPRVVLTVRVSPATAVARVDGRSLGAGAIAVLPGRHQVVATGPGLHQALRAIETKSDTTVRLALPAALSPELERALGGAMWNGGPWPAGLDALATTAELDRIVVVSARAVSRGAPEARAVLWARGAATPFAVSHSHSVDAAGISPALADWCAAALAGKSGAVPKSAVTKGPARGGKTTPLTRKPLFWGAVGVGVLAIVAGGAAAAYSGGGGGTGEPTDDGTTTVTFGGLE